MINNNDYSNLFTKEELDEAKDNLFDILGELYNGETMKIILSDTEREIKKDFKVVLPKGYEENTKLNYNSNKKVFNIILNLFINLIMNLNPISEENEELYYLKISIITIICLGGTLTKEKNFIVSDIEFNENYIKENKKKLTKDQLEKIGKVISLFPTASNFVAFSTLNYIRFNHHFPYEKNHLIKKALMSFDESIVHELLTEENKDTFYNILVAPARINNELLFYEKIFYKKYENLHENKFKYYKLLGTTPLEFLDESLDIRKDVTPNGYLVLDLIAAMIDEIKAKSLLFLVPNIEIFAKLINIRNHLRKNPFGYHNAKFFFSCAANDCDEIRKKFLSYMSIVGGFIYNYTSNMEDSIIQAKCRIKYKNKVKLEDERIVKLIQDVAKSEISFDKKTIDYIKSKINKNNYKIDENLDIEEANEKALKILEENVKDF